MPRDFSFEKNITDGKVQAVRRFITDFNTAEIVFENMTNQQQKILKFSRIVSLSVNADPDMNSAGFFSAENLSVQTLFGFDFEKNKDGYVFCIRTDDYEIIIKSPDFVILENLV